MLLSLKKYRRDSFFYCVAMCTVVCSNAGMGSWGKSANVRNRLMSMRRTLYALLRTEALRVGIAGGGE